jgi:hypothetical protein
MTLPPPDHIHISEREADGSWEDCTWDSGLEWYRLVYDARKPATHAEAQLLRRASGEPATGGSNMTDLARGIKARYGTTVPARIIGFAALQAALTPGKVAVIQGSMSAFGPTHRLSTYDRNFDGSHALVLMNIDGVLLWCDPEAPTTAAVPVVVTWAEVKAFVTKIAGEHLVGAIKNLPKEAAVPLVTYLPGYTAVIKTGSNIRSEPRIASTRLHALSAPLPVVVVGTVKGDVDPANGSDVWYELFHENRSEFTAKDNVTNLQAPAAPVTTPAYPDLSSEVQRLNALVAAQTAALDAAAPKAAALDALSAALKAVIS